METEKLTEDDHFVRPNKVQSCPSSEGRDQENPGIRVIVESVDRGHPYGGVAGQRADCDHAGTAYFRIARSNHPGARNPSLRGT